MNDGVGEVGEGGDDVVVGGEGHEGGDGVKQKRICSKQIISVCVKCWFVLFF